MHGTNGQNSHRRHDYVAIQQINANTEGTRQLWYRISDGLQAYYTEGKRCQKASNYEERSQKKVRCCWQWKEVTATIAYLIRWPLTPHLSEQEAPSDGPSRCCWRVKAGFRRTLTDYSERQPCWSDVSAPLCTPVRPPQSVRQRSEHWPSCPKLHTGNNTLTHSNIRRFMILDSDLLAS